MSRSYLNIFKPLLIGVAGLSLVVIIISSLMPSDVVMIRSVSINAAPSKVMAEIRNLQNWQHWHPYFKNADSGISYSKNRIIMNPEGNTGMLVTASNDSLFTCSIVYYQKGKNDYQNNFQFYISNDSSRTEVHWQAGTRLSWYPWEKFSGIFFEKTAAPSYETALNALKEYCEKN